MGMVELRVQIPSNLCLILNKNCPASCHLDLNETYIYKSDADGSAVSGVQKTKVVSGCIRET